MVVVGDGEKIGWSRDCDTGTKGGDGGCDSDGSCGGSCSTRGSCGNDGGDCYSGGVYPSMVLSVTEEIFTTIAALAQDKVHLLP